MTFWKRLLKPATVPLPGADPKPEFKPRLMYDRFSVGGYHRDIDGLHVFYGGVLVGRVLPDVDPLSPRLTRVLCDVDDQEIQVELEHWYDRYQRESCAAAYAEREAKRLELRAVIGLDPS